ncbi:TetR/AcrR family transcriptional regulator [Amycolatopsis cihanbeyliensis]|uniref:TetR family transcriptional regulator n=1 Tax=Amycolatopsis cihanbeyliensis TaxID=1128664 RepID=A0A542DIW5_AMYCI|nr:TetR/AcrR family transcriptional regulator [Amycolatopsis cihanbeyliensis]TQJ03051.1 TetR family transcriptional regulator [Amycolatopsis cihanbeyliensis]
MRTNPERRAALADAAVEVLARSGARGLTFRAVDAGAGVPAGTASNYFANRDDLLWHAATKIHERLGPGVAELAAYERAAPSRELVAEMLRGLLERVREDRTGYLALLELRLEATRRPGLREALTGTIRANLDGTIQGHLDRRLPGDETTVVLLYLAMTGLIVEQLTLPEVLPASGSAELIAALVDRLLPGT